MYGRGVNIWGRGKQGTLALSGYASPYEMLKLETEFWRLRYTFLAAELEQYPPIAQFYYHNPPGVYSDSVTVAKRMSAHRVETDITDRLTIGLHETVIYGGRWDLSYLNPVMFYKSAEHTNGDHDNAAMGADFHLIVHRSHSVYGELFIDDITTGKLGTSWYGNKLGWQLGTISSSRSASTTRCPLRVHPRESVGIHPRISINTYSQYGSTLGYRTGPNPTKCPSRYGSVFRGA